MKKALSLLLTLVLLLCVIALPTFAQETAKAATMRLSSAQGSVTVKDSGGIDQPVLENMRLYSGSVISTGDESYAYILLDDDKAVKLDQNTTVKIKKSFLKLQVQLTSGQLFFNVTAPLTENESLEIRTSSMVTGIRGSSGLVTTRTVAFLTGHGTTVCMSEDGQLLSFDLVGGEGVIYGLETDRPEYEKITLTGEEFPSFVLQAVADSTQLQEEIAEEGKLDVQTLLDSIPEKQAEEAEARAAAQAELTVPAGSEAEAAQVPAFTRGGTDENADSGFWYDEGEDEPADEPTDNPTDIPSDNPPDDTVSYSVTLNANGGMVQSGEISSYGAEGAALPSDVVRTGYDFRGWYEREDLSGEPVTGIPVGSAGDKVFWAMWSPTVYAISYELDGGTNSEENPAVYTIESKDIVLQAPTRERYSFLGWLEQTESSPEAGNPGKPSLNLTIPSGSMGDRSFKAVWQLNSIDFSEIISTTDDYTVDFPNGSIGTIGEAFAFTLALPESADEEYLLEIRLNEKALSEEQVSVEGSILTCSITVPEEASVEILKVWPVLVPTITYAYDYTVFRPDVSGDGLTEAPVFGRQIIEEPIGDDGEFTESAFYYAYDDPVYVYDDMSIQVDYTALGEDDMPVDGWEVVPDLESESGSAVTINGETVLAPLPFRVITPASVEELQELADGFPAFLKVHGNLTATPNEKGAEIYLVRGMILAEDFTMDVESPMYFHFTEDSAEDDSALIVNYGSITVGRSGLLYLDTGVYLVNNGTVTNSGTITLPGGFIADTYIDNGGTLNNTESGDDIP